MGNLTWIQRPMEYRFYIIKTTENEFGSYLLYRHLRIHVNLCLSLIFLWPLHLE